MGAPVTPEKQAALRQRMAAVGIDEADLTEKFVRLFNRRDSAKMPKFLRKSAMGVDVLFK